MNTGTTTNTINNNKRSSSQLCSLLMKGAAVPLLLATLPVKEANGFVSPAPRLTRLQPLKVANPNLPIIDAEIVTEKTTTTTASHSRSSYLPIINAEIVREPEEEEPYFDSSTWNQAVERKEEVPREPYVSASTTNEAVDPKKEALRNSHMVGEFTNPTQIEKWSRKAKDVSRVAMNAAMGLVLFLSKAIAKASQSAGETIEAYLEKAESPSSSSSGQASVKDYSRPQRIIEIQSPEGSTDSIFDTGFFHSTNVAEQPSEDVDVEKLLEELLESSWQ